jgi:hypothetical protein
VMQIGNDIHVNDTCRIGQGPACCRYLTADAAGYSCEKTSPIGRVIDARVAAGTFGSLGDNCTGPPDFTPREEGQ